MTVKITKPALNLREELNSLKQPAGLSALLEKIGAASNRIQVSSDMTVAGTATFTDSIEMAYSGGLNTFNLLSNNTGSGTLNILSNAQAAGTDKYINIGKNTGSASGTATFITMGDDSDDSLVTVLSDFKTTGQVTVTSGALSAPSYSFVGDTDTGISRPTANAVNIVTGGTERVKVTNSAVILNEYSVDQDFRVESDSSTHMLYVDGGDNHVGVDWATPDVPLDVNGVISSRPHGSGAAYSHGLLEISSSATNPQVKITTNILWSGGTTHAHTVKISGFMYGSAKTCEVVICWHKYNNSFYNRTASSSGGFAPDITLAVENNKVVIHLGTVGYWTKLYVESMYNAFGGTGQAKGWSWSDAAISADSNTPTETVSYKTDLGGDNLIGTAGAVFNEGSADQDFRVESANNTHTLFVDSSADKVMVGTSVGSKTFSVLGSFENAGFYRNFTGAGTAANYVGIGRTDSAGTLVDGVRITGGGDENAEASHNGYFNLEIRHSGNFRSLLSAFSSGNELVVNDGGLDMDFRVESDAFSSALTVEGSSGKVNVATHFGIGKTSSGEQQSAGSGFFFVPGSSGYYSHISTIDTANFSSYFNRKTQTGGFFNFAVDNVGVGSVTYSGSVTVYSTASDERLKENIEDADDAGSKIDAMQVRQFDWKSNGQHQEYGMVAQELLPIAPDSIAQGETEEDMMGVDYSTLVPMLIKEIQQLRQRVAQLES